MRVEVRFSIEVDEGAWIEDYGTPRKNIREDVRTYAYEQVAQSPAAISGKPIREVFLRR